MIHPKISFLILAVLSLLLLSAPVKALEETFQWYPLANSDPAFYNLWNLICVSPCNVGSIASYGTTYNKVAKLSVRVCNTGCGGTTGSVTLINNVPLNTDYIAFNAKSSIRTSSDGYQCSLAAHYCETHINLYDTNGIYISRIYVSGTSVTTSETLTERSFEIIRDSTTGIISYKINGVSQGVAGASALSFGYVAFQAQATTNWVTSIVIASLYIDDFTTTGYISSVGTETAYHSQNELNLHPITTSYLLKTIPEAEYTASQFDIIWQKALANGTLQTIRTTNIKNATISGIYVGSFTLDRYDNLTSSDLNYGLYWEHIIKNGVSQSTDYFFLVPPGAANTITVADTSAVIGQSEAITYSIGTPDFTTNSYYVNIYNTAGLVTSVALTDASGIVNWDTSGNSAGIYFIVLSQVTSGIQTDLAYTTINLVSTLLIRGTVYDAKNSTTLSGTFINFSQNALWYNTTSATDGTYNLSGLFVGLNTNINASKIGWIHNNFSFTPLAAQVYTINLYMINASFDCSTIGGATNTCINGMVESIPYHQAIEGATVFLGNSTYQTSTTSNATTGYYQFLGLNESNDSYVVNATKSGYMNSIDYNVTTISGTDVQQIILMYQIYTLSIVAQDSTNANTILDFIATFNGTLYNTSVGTITIPNLIYGSYPTIVSSSGYLSKSQTILVDSTKTSIFILTPITPPIQSTTFKTLPHNVRFQIQDYTGRAHVGIPVTVQGWSTTVGTWAQLGQLLGLDFTTTPINNESMSGTTGIDGSIAFMMMDTVYYSVNFNGGSAYNITWYLYPKEDFYLLMIPLSSPNSGCSQNITYNLTQTTINTTHTALGLTYSDPSGHTTLINFFVQNNQSTYLYTNSSASSSLTDSFAVNSSVTGTTYFWGFNSTETGGCTLAQTQVITFRGSGKLIDLHISKGYYQWISIILIVFMASLFSIKKIKFGAVITPLTAGTLYAFGWFTINPILLSIAIVIGIMIYLRASEQKVIY